MTDIYKMVGISKQAHYKRINQRQKFAQLSNEVVQKALVLRKEHPRLGCRKLYYEIQPKGIGRDKTESLLLSQGFRIKPMRSYKRTTYSGKQWYPNLIQGKEINAINQLWVSDITYISVGYRQYFYLTLIQDVYSRKITGWSLSRNLSAENTVIAAYKRATDGYYTGQLKGLIFHTDKGSQYSSNELQELHLKNEVTPSMGGKAWENAHAESLNGVLKNEYINFEHLQLGYKQIKKLVGGIVEKYNKKRPHGSLNRMKPVEFENFVQLAPAEQRPTVKINY